MTNKPRAYTEEELRKSVLDTMRAIANYWAGLPDKSPKERCDGLAFSILNIFDSTNAGLPAFDIVARPHPDDKAYHIGEGENWIEDGTVINSDCMLHDLWCKR